MAILDYTVGQCRRVHELASSVLEPARKLARIVEQVHVSVQAYMQPELAESSTNRQQVGEVKEHKVDEMLV